MEKASLVANKEAFISCSGRAEMLGPALIHVAELQQRLTTVQPSYVSCAKVRRPDWKRSSMQLPGLRHLKYLNPQILLNSLSLHMVHFPV